MKLKNILMSTAAATLIAGGAIAQDTATTESGVTDTVSEAPMLAPTFTSIEEMTVGDMIGMYVYDPEGDQISEIDYVVSGMGGPEVVLGIGGFLGLGEYTVALPLDQFDLGDDGNSLRLNTDKETLKTYPEFDETNAESLPDETSIASLLAQIETDEPATAAEEAMPEAEVETDMTEETDMPEETDMTDEGDTADETEAEETTTQ